MKRKVKIKLNFDANTSIATRRAELLRWATGVYRITHVIILEEKHLERMSYMIFQNPR